MKYDFDAVHDRAASDSVKWSADGRTRPDVLPLWLADMDFAVAEPIARAVEARAAHHLYGYGHVSAEHRRAVCERLARLYGWRVEPEWLVFTAGLNPTITAAVHAFVPTGGAAIIQTPAYGPFRQALVGHDRKAVENPLRLAGQHYEVDFADLDRGFAEPGVAAFILCSPHNPIGRVWTVAELERVAESAARHGTVIISDEIYSDIIMPGHRHTPIASLSPEIGRRTVTLMSPGKCFNIGGLFVSYAIIPDVDLRDAFVRTSRDILGEVGVFGLTALIAAYEHGDEWLTEVTAYIAGNFAALKDFIAKRTPTISVGELEGSYLAWLDCRRLPLGGRAPDAFFLEQAGVRAIAGGSFGAAGEGFVRLNLACPRAMLSQALERMDAAVTRLGGA